MSMDNQALFKLKYVACLTLFAVLASCGGSGAPKLVVPLRAALRNLAINGTNFTLIARGTSASDPNGLCTGTLHVVQAPATISSTSFNSVAQPLASASTVEVDFTNCTPISTITNGTDYYDSNYLPLGSQSTIGLNNVVTGVYAQTPVIPDTVSVGTVGIIGTVNMSSNGNRTGYANKTFVIEAETDTTAIANAITKSYDTTGNLISTTQVRYRINAAGTFTPVSEDIQNNTGAMEHYLFK